MAQIFPFFVLFEDNEQRYNNSFYISSLYPLISDDKLDIRLSGDPDRYLCIVLSACSTLTEKSSSQLGTIINSQH